MSAESKVAAPLAIYIVSVPVKVLKPKGGGTVHPRSTSPNRPTGFVVRRSWVQQSAQNATGNQTGIGVEYRLENRADLFR